MPTDSLEHPVDFTVRDDLIDKVRRGELTPDEAETEAERQDLGPLAHAPDPATFNPMGEPWWTLPMALAWIAWRTPKHVCWFWDAYRKQCWDWHFRRWRIGPAGPVYNGHFLEQRRPATVTLLSLAEKYDVTRGLLPDGAISIKEAKQKLWQALSEGRFEAEGISRATGERTTIPEYEWRDLTDIEVRKRDVLRLREARGGLSDRGYDDVVFRRQNIMAIWQPLRLEERDKTLPPLMKPEGPGFMPLYCAAQWIATQGGAIVINPHDVTIWKAAYSALLARIASNEVVVVGMRGGEQEKVAGQLFASIRVDYPFSDTPIDLMLNEELYLSCCPYFDEEDWRKGWDDHLETRWGIKWSRLMVLKSDVARHWPFSIGGPGDEASAPMHRTGAPGRPSAMHIVTNEHRARLERGDAKKSVVAESEALSEWLHNKYPALPALTPKTIRNKISTEHRQRKASARK